MTKEFDPFDTPEMFDDYEEHTVSEHHHKLTTRLAKPGEDIINSLTPEKAHLLHMVVGACTETGELLDAIKKHVFYNQELDIENVVEEIGDTLFYLQGICNTLNIDMALCKIHNIVKLEKRYGEAYSDDAAKNRVDKE